MRRTRVGTLRVLAGVVFGALLFAPSALADAWLPHSAGATWTYGWSDSLYSPSPTQEQYTVCDPSKLVNPCPTTPWVKTSTTFILGWQAINTNPYYVAPDLGNISFLETTAGLINTNWASTPPPTQFPILCSSATNCANSLSGALYNVIWGARQPVLLEPLYVGLSWSSTGGAANDVASVSHYVGARQVTVPAFPKPVTAAVVTSNITQAGALGDPYGSGSRTVWWVQGVGPVKVTFQHAGGVGAPTSTVTLDSTNLKPQAPPEPYDYFPLVQGRSHTYRWTNSKYLRTPEVEKITNAAVQNRSARYTVANVSGPMKVAGNFGVTVRLSGLSPLFSAMSAATKIKFPALGRGQRFLSPYDLMGFGFGQILPAYPAIGNTWKAGPGNQAFTVYGVRGTSKVIALQKLKVPAGSYTNVLEVRSKITQKGYRYGSGTRYMWFAPNVGLVKLIFRHDDGSVSTVELVK